MSAVASGGAAAYHLLAVTAANTGGPAYYWIYVVLGVIGIVGAGVATLRWLNARAVRESKLDRLLLEVKPNGGQTLSLGDTVARTESKVDALIVTVATQKGHTDAVEREVYRRINNLETRGQVRERLEQEKA